jgi:hypothetical protein
VATHRAHKGERLLPAGHGRGGGWGCEGRVWWWRRRRRRERGMGGEGGGGTRRRRPL